MQTSISHKVSEEVIAKVSSFDVNYMYAKCQLLMKFVCLEKGEPQLDLAGDHSVKDSKQFLGYAHRIIRDLGQLN